MTRDEARQKALDCINEGIKKYGEDAPFISCPRPGKNTWTFKEAREAVEQDKSLNGIEDNLIDDVLKAYDCLEELKNKKI